jgi:hypothetical protein
MKIIVLPYVDGPTITLRPETEAETFQLEVVAEALEKFHARFNATRQWTLTSIVVEVKGK